MGLGSTSGPMETTTKANFRIRFCMGRENNFSLTVTTSLVSLETASRSRRASLSTEMGVFTLGRLKTDSNTEMANGSRKTQTSASSTTGSMPTIKKTATATISGRTAITTRVTFSMIKCRGTAKCTGPTAHTTRASGT